MQDNKNGSRKQSFSYPYEGTDKEGPSKALVLSQTAKPTTSSESHLQPKRGILLVILPIIFFSAWISSTLTACGPPVGIMWPATIFANHVHTMKITQ
jgi:hypothetical protein